MAASYEDRILRVLSYIYDNLSGDLSLDRLADVAAMSRFHWHRVFRAVTGETCAQAVRRLRLHRAAVSLVQTDHGLSRIAADVGYSNFNSFSRAFTDAFGCTPAAYRKADGVVPPLTTLKIGEFPMFPVDIRVEPARRLAVLPHTGAYSEIGKSFAMFSTICASRQLWPQFRRMVGVYLDNPECVAEADLRSFAGAEFHGETIPDGMQELDILGGRTAVLTYKGPYANIQVGYDSLFGNWLVNSGEEPADRSCYEVYLNNPGDTAPDELETEIHLPLA